MERQSAAGCSRRRRREGPQSVDGRLFQGGSKMPAKHLRYRRSLELCPRGVSPVLLKYIKTPRYIKKGDCCCCPVLSGSSSVVARRRRTRSAWWNRQILNNQEVWREPDWDPLDFCSWTEDHWTFIVQSFMFYFYFFSSLIRVHFYALNKVYFIFIDYFNRVLHVFLFPRSSPSALPALAPVTQVLLSPVSDSILNSYWNFITNGISVFASHSLLKLAKALYLYSTSRCKW